MCHSFSMGRLLVLVSPLCLVLNACCEESKEPRRPPSPPAAGKITSTGGGADFTLELVECQNGVHYEFFGVDLYATKNAEGNKRRTDKSHVRFVRDAVHGKVLKVTVPESPRELVFHETDCVRMEDQMTRSHRNDSTTYMAGTISFDCTHSDGKGRVEGTVTFHDCY